MVAQQDPELIDWLMGIAHGRPWPAGDFLFSLADAALRADNVNYPLLREGLLAIKAEYPYYMDDGGVPNVPGR